MDMLYAALGDSITYGFCASSRGYVTHIQRSLSKEDPVNVFLQAKPGWTSKQLLTSLTNVPDCIWAEARLVTVMIGGNDLLKATPWLLSRRSVRIKKFGERLKTNLSKIIQLVRRPRATIILATQYNPFPNFVLAEECTEMINNTIRLVAQNEGVELSDVQKQFFRQEHELIDGYRRGQLRDFRFIGNPIHPNDMGHERIAREFLRAYDKNLANVRSSRG